MIWQNILRFFRYISKTKHQSNEITRDSRHIESSIESLQRSKIVKGRNRETTVVRNKPNYQNVGNMNARPVQSNQNPSSNNYTPLGSTSNQMYTMSKETSMKTPTTMPLSKTSKFLKLD